MISKLERWEKPLLVCLAGTILFFSTFHLTESPSVWYDEGLYYQTSANLSSGNGMTFQFAPGQLVDMMPRFTAGYPFIYSLAATFKVFGTGILVARSLMVFWILTLCVGGYLLIRKRFGIPLALASLALVGTFPPLYGNGKSFLGEVPALALLVVSLLCFQRMRRSSPEGRSALWILFSGLFAGLAAAAKTSFLVFLPAFAIIAIIEWYRGNLSRKEFILAGAFSFLPVAAWFLTQFNALDSFRTIFTFYVVNPSGAVSVFATMRENLKNFLTEAGPLYLLLMMAVWTASLVIRKRRKAEIPAEERMGFIFSILISAAYFRITGWHRYILPAQIVAMWYFIPSFSVCAERVSEIIEGKSAVLSRLIRKFSVALALLLLFAWGIYGILFNSWVADFYSSHKTAFWQNYFKDAPESRSVFFYDAPEVALFFPNRNYYQYLLLFPVGGPFGSLKPIEEGKADEVVIRSDFLEGQKALLSKHYHPVLEAYKYTILDRNALEK